MSRPIKPTDGELEIFNILWKKGPSTVRVVHEQLNKDAGYTTTLKIMQIMAEKGLVTRNEEGRTHIYTAAAPEEETQQHLLNRFLDTAFRGSAMKLVMQALGNRKTSKDELNQIRNLLDRMEEEPRE